jgi:glycosyltransferase involved in cell wall biosynthesis
VIDDGSNDNTRSIATRVPGVRCVSQSNAGLAAARNAGIRCSNGSFLVFLDADDRLLPVALECGLQCFSLHPEAALVAGQARVIAADGVPLFPKASPPDLPDGDPYLALLRKNRIPVPATAMYRRTVLRAVGGFDGTLDASADHEIYLRVARQFPVRWHAEPVAEYRRHGGSMSRNPELMLSTALAVVRLQRQYTRGSAQARSAYRDGIRFLRDLYGEQVLEKARGFAGRLPGRRLWRSCVTLLRYDRRRLLRLLYLSLRPAPRPRAAARLEADDATELMRRER